MSNYSNHEAQKNGFKCPLCGEHVNYRQWLSTHVYACHTCPFVAFEYYDDKNLSELKDYIDFNETPESEEDFNN